MVRIGYTLSSEEFGPTDLVAHARGAEEAGFSFALISDHFHPWIDRQGHSPFVWTVLGALSETTESLPIGVGVTCPTMRIHPAIVAHSAATAATMMPGRFFLGVGSGELLNEHIVARHWPETKVRQEMLAEAIEVIRLLWSGGLQSHRGRHFTVENARIYTLPDEPPPLLVAAAGPSAGTLAGEAGDGMIGTAPDEETVRAFDEAGGAGKPRIGQLHLCWAQDEAEARRTALEMWPIGGISGELNPELPLPSDFEAAAKTVREEDLVGKVPCGPDPEPIMEQISKFEQAGFDHVYLHQIGPDQEGFLRFAKRELLPQLETAPAEALTA